jgi:hypothetical protein
MSEVNPLSIHTIAGLRDETERLRHVRHELAMELERAAELLLSPGHPPDAVLIEKLHDYRQAMLQLGNALGADTDAGGLSFNHIETLLEIRDCRKSAEDLRDQLADLSHVDITDFAPLDLCRNEASRLCQVAREQVGLEIDSELELIQKRRHPLNSLIRLCDEGDLLTDADWTECHDEVAATYGRQLATALTRGRIQRKTRGSADTPAAPSPDDADIPAMNMHLECRTDAFAANEAIFDDMRPISTEVACLRATDLRAAVLQETVLSSEFMRTEPPQSERPRLETRSFSTLESPGAAERMLPALQGGNIQSGGTSDRILQLMADGRLPMAWQLRHCLDQRGTSSETVPPAWLLRALILGRHLSYSKGEIARQLDDELRTFRAEMLTEGTDECRLSMAFLLRAAALPAALFAGSAPASAILRSFKIEPGFSQLYNYCSRIALYGDRLAGHLVELFRPAGTIAGASELEELGREAQGWLQELAKTTTSWTRTSPLFLHAHWTLSAGTAVRHADATLVWCKWQETLLLIHRLLKPVCEGDSSERNWVRQEVARLSSQVRVEPLEPSNRIGIATIPTSRGIVLPLEEMHTAIQEGVAIANRWLRLCHQTSSTASPIPLEALELRDEITKRSEGVLSELSQHRQSAESPCVKAAIACCQNAVRQIQALFESRVSLPVVEPDQRHIFNADLLKYPGIELDDQWLPVTEPAVVERELVVSLDRGEMSWRQAYEFHSDAGNHEATGRLLDLDVWPTAEERETLRALRQSRIEALRSAAESELSELALGVSVNSDSDSWTESERVAVQMRIARLRRDLTRVVNFCSFHRQVNQLQSTIQRQRTCIELPGAILAAGELAAADSRRHWTATPSPHFEAFIPSCDIFSGE